MDQILLWDTDPDGRVSLSAGDPVRLRRKIRASHLVGGRVLVRPAELFEGDHILESATSASGELLNLRDAGMACLVVGEGDDLTKRLEWKFNKAVLFDRGREITSQSERQKLYSRLQRVRDRLIALRWEEGVVYHPANLVQKRPDEFRATLERASLRYMECFPHRSGFLDFLNPQQERVIRSRSDLYPQLHRWATDLPTNLRQPFVRDMKLALTVQAILQLAGSVGDRVSELRPSSFRGWSIGEGNAAAVEFVDRTLSVAQTLVEEQREVMIPATWRTSIAAELFDAPPSTFIRWAEAVSARDRQDLEELLFGVSQLDEFEGRSLVVTAMMKGRSVSRDSLKTLVRARVLEFEKKSARSAKGAAFLVKKAPALLIPVYSKVISVLEGLAYLTNRKLPTALSGERVVLAGLRKARTSVS